MKQPNEPKKESTYNLQMLTIYYHAFDIYETDLHFV